jgi:hypothetical protein
MAERWLTLAAAAAALNVHPRTIERRIASGKIQSRRTDDGQLQVLLLNAPDETPTTPDPIETVRELAQDQVSLATGSASAIVRLAHADADRARAELDLARHDAGRARKGARVAWTTVGLMSGIICTAVGWTTYRITRASEQVRSLEDRAAFVENEAKQLLVERDRARQDAETARLEEAEATGRLAAYVEQAQLRSRVSDTRPTTRPSDFLHRIADAIAGQ